MTGAYDTAWLLEKVQALIRRYVHMTDDQLLAVSLWVLFTWVVDAFDVAPYLDVSSPVRGCGKTRLFEVLELVCRSPRRCTGHTEATLFRMVEAEHPTMLLDEIDSTFGKDPKLYAGIRGVLDEGHRRGGSVPRMVGEGKRMELKYFDVFGPKAFAGIGNLPETVATRSAPIGMEKMPPGEKVSRFRYRHARAQTEELRAALSEWAAAITPKLEDVEPMLPDGLSDRQWDIWEPLLALADEADVGSEARAAAVALHTGAISEVSAGMLALEHLRLVFDGQERMPTKDVLENLVAIEGGPWGAWWGTDVDTGHTKRPASRLAKILRPFGIEPKQLWIDGRNERGYQRSDLEPVWARYLSPLPNTPPTDPRTLDARPDPSSDQPSNDLASPAGERGPSDSVDDGTCPACGARSAAKGYKGHAEGCPYYYGRVIPGA